MNLQEKKIVSEEFCERKDTYNICQGGTGGFGYVNNSGIYTKEMRRNSIKIAHMRYEELRKNPEWREKDSQRRSQRRKAEYAVMTVEERKKRFSRNSTLGDYHTEETKQKMRLSHIGKLEGSYWITDGKNSKQIKREDLDNWLSIGYYRGMRKK